MLLLLCRFILYQIGCFALLPRQENEWNFNVSLEILHWRMNLNIWEGRQNKSRRFHTVQEGCLNGSIYDNHINLVYMQNIKLINTYISFGKLADS